MTIYIKNGRVIDPANNFDAISDVFIKDGSLTKTPESPKADLTINADGLWVVPGFIDLHTHLREPGFERKETIETGAAAAAAGGFSAICAMPNTNPVADSVEVLSYIKNKAESCSSVRVFPICSVTAGMRGRELNDYAALRKYAVAISEDGKSVQDDSVMEKAFFKAKAAGLKIFSHCERESLMNGGVINDGAAAERFGFPGITSETEETIIERDIRLAEKAGASLHICHVSSAGGVTLIRQARERGVDVTCEVCPHHFTLTDEDITDDDSNFKMAPPLRSRIDRAALIEGLRDGTISAIATDHAPHSARDKEGGFLKAANGIIGLETALPLAISELSRVLTPSEIISKMSLNPARILGVAGGTLSVGASADVTIINPSERYKIDISIFRSKSKNSPFNGRAVVGRVIYSIISGRVAYDYRQTNR
ncbi:MAG: dihydroorotase [Clostridiales bacterium]|jgi:dihydroorotase|nr:dihydroorotase [Clostridiales bacterium]